MPLFKKNEKISTSLVKNTEENSSPDMNKVEKWLDDVEEKPENIEKSKEKVIKKKTRIGFRRPEKKQEEETTQEDDLLHDLEDTDESKNDSDEEKKPFTSKKKKPIIKKDMKDKPVYLEDTGEKLGTVFDQIYDKDDNLIGYKIKDEKSNSVLSFPSEQFDYNKDGLIFIPGWYTNSLKIIEKLEFKDKVSPDLTALLSDDITANEELYEIFVKHDDDMANYIDDAISLKEIINNRLRLLEKQRLATKNDLMDLTERRLIKDIDRKEFSDEILRHRRKVNILDININKCKDLLKRLENTSFGVLCNINFDSNMDKIKEEQFDKKLYTDVLESKRELDRQILQREEKDSYKDKYFALKEQYEQLENDFQELKIAVDKLFNKDELGDYDK